MSYRNVIGASMFALGVAFAGTAFAANTEAAKPAQAEAEAATFSEEKLASFAAAHKKVDMLDKQYQQRMNGAADPAAKKQVEQLKNIDLSDAVKSEGLTTAEYNEIFMAMKADPALASKIASLKTAAAAKPADTKIQ
jgi:hypothetical protein